MEREEMLAYLQDAAPYYEQIERETLRAHPQVEVVLAGKKLENASFRFYHKRKFIAYFNILPGAFDFMTRYTAEDIAQITPMMARLSAQANEVWARRYPCGTGAWIHYLVSSPEQRDEALQLLAVKLKSVIRK